MRALPFILCVLAAGCTSARPVEGTRAFTYTWKDDLAPILAERCGSCHGAAAAGGYSVLTYMGTIGLHRSAGPVAIAGDASSLLLRILDPATAITPHDGQASLHQLLSTWVVADQLAYVRSEVHGGGLVNPASPEFHGKVLAEHGYDFPLCQSCHGENFDGGLAKVSCLSCHTQRPTACVTCHGDSPTSGAHRAHVLGGATLGRALDCSECHKKPGDWSDAGHIRLPDGTADPAPAELSFGAFAQTATPTRSGPPAFDGTRCQNVYCHGDALMSDAAAEMTEPEWNGGSTTSCSSCHGRPPAGHPAGNCANCHGAVIDAAGVLLKNGPHLDGKPSLGDGSGTCTACHATLSGAHDSHTQATHKVTAPLACTECHFMPAQVSSPGHFTSDGFAAVFPAGGTWPLASAGAATPSFARDTMSCSDVHCHGGGAALAADMTVGLVRTPSWQPGGDVGRCGSCHGLPPIDGVHDPKLKITDCATCHPNTVDAFGQILFKNGVSTHVNGVVDAL